jgi:hypothetical protein
MMTKTFAACAATSITIALGACGSSGSKTFDIAPIFPLSSDKCAKYDGEEKGSGITASCMVTQAECEKASADWKNAMQTGGVNDAIQFSCK